MKQSLSRYQKNSKAFTLIELLVVISIIGILAAALLPAVGKAMTNAKMAATMQLGAKFWNTCLQANMESTSTGDASFGWPGDCEKTTVSEYIQVLSENGLFKQEDIKSLVASGSKPIASIDGVNADTISWRIGMIGDSAENNSVFMITKNHPGSPSKELKGEPFKDAGFLVIKKSGEATKYNQNQGDKVELIGALPEQYLQ
ncbi:MAG: type II secretion system protein [Verrucomicrobiota bacterium]